MSVSYPYFSLAKDHQQYGLILEYVAWFESCKLFDPNATYAKLPVELRSELINACRNEHARRRCVMQVNYPLLEMWIVG